jgi:hypothetical protein
MKALMLVAAALSLAPARAALANDPPVRVKLSDDRVAVGDKERVRVRPDRDGYLVVLQLTEAGQVKVLFPVDPDDVNRVRGGKEVEIRSRGDREAFVATRAGTGTVLAARSDTPFNFAAFTTQHHWNAQALSPVGTKDGEAALVAVLDAMTRERYDYDVVNYTVRGGPGRNGYAGPYPGYWYTSAYDPWWPYYGPPFGYGFRANVIIPFGGRRGRRW